MVIIADPELDNVETEIVRYKPEGLDALCRLTKFTRKELQIMYRGFKQVRCNNSLAVLFVFSTINKSSQLFWHFCDPGIVYKTNVITYLLIRLHT